MPAAIVHVEWDSASSWWCARIHAFVAFLNYPML
jgi:hypothetical protein